MGEIAQGYQSSWKFTGRSWRGGGVLKAKEQQKNEIQKYQCKLCPNPWLIANFICIENSGSPEKKKVEITKESSFEGENYTGKDL